MRLYPKAGIARQERAVEKGFEGWAVQDKWGIFRESPGTYRALRWKQGSVHRYMCVYLAECVHMCACVCVCVHMCSHT